MFMQIEKQSQNISFEVEPCEEIPTVPEASLKTHKRHVRRLTLTLILMCTIVTTAIVIALFATLPQILRGYITIGNSDTVLISAFDSSIIKEVDVSLHDAIEVDLYQDVCSNFGPLRQLHNSTLQLNISDSMQYNYYIID